jgi:hypothetical protein
MRRTDRLECELRWGTAAEALRVSMVNSVAVWAVLAGDTLLAVAGVVEGGAAWVLTSEAVELHRFTFWRASKRVLALMLLVCPQGVDGWILHSYERSVRWAKALGFRSRESHEGFTRYVFEAR